MSTTNLSFLLTDAGRNAALSNTGIDLPISHIQLGDGHATPNGNETALASPKETAFISAAARITTGQWRFGSIVLGSGLNYGVSEIGLWSGDPAVGGSTLVFYWSMATGEHGIKAPGIDFNVETDIFFGNVVPGNITIVADTQFNALSMLAQHNAHADPHTGYLKESAVHTVTVNSFIKTSNASPNVSLWSDARHINSGDSLDYPVQTVTLTGVPTGATIALMRFRVAADYAGNVYRQLWVRKNNTEAWSLKGVIDPNHGAAPPEGEIKITLPIVFDVAGNTFQYYVDFNDPSSFGSAQAFDDVVDPVILVEVNQEGFWVPTTVLAMV